MPPTKRKEPADVLTDRRTDGCLGGSQQGWYYTWQRLRENTPNSGFFACQDLSNIDTKVTKVILQLLLGLEDDASHTEPLGCPGIGGNVVNVKGFLSPDLASVAR